jgi:hypothetical protein
MIDPHGNPLDTEKTDASPRPILKALFYLIGVTTLVGLGLVYLTHGLVDFEAKGDPPPAPLAAVTGGLPPEPRLQTRPFADIEEQRAEEQQVLTSYGWVDEKAGIVRIPIEEAMRLLAERQAAQPAAAQPSPAPESK